MVKQTRYQSSQCGELRLQKKDQVIKIKVDEMRYLCRLRNKPKVNDEDEGHPNNITHLRDEIRVEIKEF